METTIVKPQQVIVTGVVSGVSAELSSDSGKVFRMLELECGKEEIKTFPISDAFYKRFADRLVPEATIALTIQKTIKDKTQYLDKKDGNKAKFHTATGDSIVNITHRSSTQANLDQLDDKLESLVARFENNPALFGAAFNAYAQYFAARK